MKKLCKYCDLCSRDCPHNDVQSDVAAMMEYAEHCPDYIVAGKITDYLSQDEIRLQAVEELSELVQALLKYRRALGEETTNYTPKSKEECLDNIGEEWCDVIYCMNLLDSKTYFSGYHGGKTKSEIACKAARTAMSLGYELTLEQSEIRKAEELNIMSALYEYMSGIIPVNEWSALRRKWDKTDRWLYRLKNRMG